ncbi:RluA family pseudouridine synthase [Streptococcus sp. E24BD]|uniref:RluA family pseudouridine synthase n=1 Tax=Streptococcus sp. E24BD TaxID=3278715 RepID=UPI00359E6408
MTTSYTIHNTFADCSVKELLEKHLLIPRKIRHFLRTKKHLLVNGRAVNWQSSVHLGDVINLTFDEEDYPQKTLPAGNADLIDCLYEDDHLIIVNKPEGLKTHGNEPTEIALLNHVSTYAGCVCYIVHRLDMETSGAVLFAKNPFILPLLNRLLEQKRIKRQYLALVDGILPKTRTISDKIGRHRHDRRRRVVDHRHGQVALTRVSPVQFDGQQTLVSCQLETGRTHQIRVHLSHQGLPLLGDPLYHPKPKGRLMLHAHQLNFTHPLTRQEIAVTCSSETFEQALKTP